MEPIPPKQQDMIEVTDSLEAVDAARGMRFFLFWFILFPALLILQIMFWLNWAGRISSDEAQPTAWLSRLTVSAPVALAAEVPPAAEEPVPVEKQTQASKEALADVPPMIPSSEIEQGVSEVTGAESAEKPAEPQAPAAAESNFLANFAISRSVAAGIVKVCNFLILMAAILYCLILLLCLKISLVGRLGGLFHVTKAFLIALLFLLVLIPWQVVMPRVMIGALWLPGELFGGAWDNIQDSIFWQILYYTRFCGLWFVAFVLLFWSRLRFVKWRRATLRRLGVLR
jgi:hypothetical protein